MRVATRAPTKIPEEMIIITPASHTLYPWFGSPGVGKPAGLIVTFIGARLGPGSDMIAFSRCRLEWAFERGGVQGGATLSAKKVRRPLPELQSPNAPEYVQRR